VRFWTWFGVLMALVGIVLFWNGINSRLGRSRIPAISASNDSLASRPIQPLDTLPVTAPVIKEAKPATPVRDSSKLIVSPKVVEPVVATTDNSLQPPTITSIEPKIRSKPKEAVAHVERENRPSEADIGDDSTGNKQLLVRLLKSAGWTQEELNQLSKLLGDPRVHFRQDLLVRNSTFEENAEQYQHNVTPESIQRCVDFYYDQFPSLKKAMQSQGVAPEVLVAILRVETNLGGWTGKESVFNVFWSLALGDNIDIQQQLLTGDKDARQEMKTRMVRRAGWAKGQLRDLLYVARNGGEDPVGIMGSFAGAFGLPQFIPSSYRSYGRDGNSDGTIDLDNLDDASASIAYYLKENGWQENSDYNRKRKVILSYNHSSFYADCVMALADSITSRLRSVPTFP
jgi:membrane-bound lytic murein transglycosylase B